ncbi:retrotransposon protein, putative, ty3-gypsy subclass [Tanacetum coccineum]
MYVAQLKRAQNSGICSPGPDGEMYYGQLQEIIEFKYLLFKVALFRVKWFDISNKGRKVNKLVLRNNMTQINCSREAFKDDQYILVTQVKQVFYLEDKTKPHWKVVEHVNHKKFSDGGVIVIRQRHVDNDPGVSATSELFALACGPTPTPISVNSCVVNGMSADVARGHGGDGGGDDRPPSHHIPTGCGGCFANRGKGTRKANLGGRKEAGRQHIYRHETGTSWLKEDLTDDKGPLPDPSFNAIPALGPDINAASSALQKLYNTNKASLKAAHWVINPETGTYDVETIRQGRPESITPADWDAQIAFWNDPRNQARAAQNRQNRAKSTDVLPQRIPINKFAPPSI